MREQDGEENFAIAMEFARPELLGMKEENEPDDSETSSLCALRLDGFASELQAAGCQGDTVGFGVAVQNG